MGPWAQWPGPGPWAHVAMYFHKDAQKSYTVYIFRGFTRNFGTHRFLLMNMHTINKNALFFQGLFFGEVFAQQVVGPGPLGPGPLALGRLF